MGNNLDENIGENASDNQNGEEGVTRQTLELKVGDFVENTGFRIEIGSSSSTSATVAMFVCGGCSIERQATGWFTHTVCSGDRQECYRIFVSEIDELNHRVIIELTWRERRIKS